MHCNATYEYDKSNSVLLFGTHFSLFMIGEVKCHTSAKQPNALRGGGGGDFFLNMVCDRYVCILGALRPVNRGGLYQCETTKYFFFFFFFFFLPWSAIDMMACSVFYCSVNRAGLYQCETTK